MKFVEKQRFDVGATVVSVAVHPTEPLVACGTSDGRVLLYNMKLGAPEWTAEWPELPGASLTPSELTLVLNDTTGKPWHLTLKNSEPVRVCDPKTGESVGSFGYHDKLVFHTHPRNFPYSSTCISGVAFLDDMLLVLDNAGRLRAHSICGGKLLFSVGAHTTYTTAITVRGDGKTIVTCDQAGAIKEWVITDGAFVVGQYEWTCKLPMALAARGDMLVCVDSSANHRIMGNANRICVLSADTERTIEEHTSCLKCVCIAEDGSVISGGVDQTIVVWKDGVARKLREHSDGVYAVAVTEGHLVSISMNGDLVVHTWPECNFVERAKVVKASYNIIMATANGWIATASANSLVIGHME